MLTLSGRPDLDESVSEVTDLLKNTFPNRALFATPKQRQKPLHVGKTFGTSSAAVFRLTGGNRTETNQPRNLQIFHQNTKLITTPESGRDFSGIIGKAGNMIHPIDRLWRRERRKLP